MALTANCPTCNASLQLTPHGSFDSWICPAGHGLAATLSELYEEARRSVETASTLLQEMHHRVRNNLQTVAALLSLQLRQVEGAEQARHPVECVVVNHHHRRQPRSGGGSAVSGGKPCGASAWDSAIRAIRAIAR